MKKSKPTEKEMKAAQKVLKYFLPHAVKLANYTQQERPFEWARALEVAHDLLNHDAEETMNDYLAEYELGR